MSPSVLMFRLLIVASLGTNLAGNRLDLTFPQLLPPQLTQAFEQLPGPAGEAAVSLGLLGFLVLGLSLAATVGLFMFKPWARGFAIIITVVNQLCYPLYGVTVRSGWSLLLTDLSSILWGAVLAFSYVSSLNRRFTFDYDDRSDDFG